MSLYQKIPTSYDGTASYDIGNYFDFYNTTTSTTCSTWDQYRYIGTEDTGNGYTGQYINLYPTYRTMHSIFGSGQNSRSEPQRPNPPKAPKPDKPDPAIEIAKTLLLEHLDDNNKKRYFNNEPIEISSKIFNDIKYQILISKYATIRALKEDKVIDRLCLVVREPESLPLEDIILAKLLHVLHNEEEMIRIARHNPESEDGNLLERISPVVIK